MLYTAEDDIRLCSSLDINPVQLMFLKMLVKPPELTRQDWKLLSYKRSLMFGDKVKGIPVKDIADLVQRDIVIDLNDKGRKQYDYYEISDEFNDLFRLHYKGLPQDIHDHYPHTFVSDGTSYVAKGCSEHDIALPYLKAINNNIEEHNEVLKDIEWGIKNNMIKLGLRKFVEGQYWKTLRVFRTKHLVKQVHNESKIV